MLGGKLISPVKSLITFFSDLDRFKGTMDSVSNIWNGQTERLGVGSPHLVKGGVELRNVTVNFGEKPALNDISVRIEPRTKVAVVGSSGAGKTTLLRLFQGFLRPNSGVMEIDGQNYRHLDLSSYRSQVALVDTTPIFFGATLEENLRIIRPNISEREFSEALKITGLGAILEGLDNGISTDINQFGLPLSQGNRVTLAIARAVISEPKILLLDEALTSLDKASRLNFLTNMNDIINQQTLIMATHDLRLLSYFDKVLVLKDGQVAGFGEHDVLITECDTYKELWSLENDLANVSLPSA
jgi:ABC-type bacteriocin/lantibiotic exporter with double-glycine peptidase domain